MRRTVQKLILWGGVSSQAAQFPSRANGLDSKHRAAYIALIDGLVADGTWALFDGLWMLAAPDAMTSFVNLIGPAFTASLLTTSVAASFTVDQGWTTTSTGVIDTGFTPSTAGGKYVQDSGSLGAYILTADAANVSAADMGTTQNPSAYFGAHVGGNFQHRVDDLTDSTGVATTNSQGFWASSRTGASARAGYGPAGSAIAIVSDSQASTGIPSASFYIGARNQGAISLPASRQYSAAFVGAGITGAQYARIAARINAYMKIFGINSF
jgi:hypothetical protein